ncbi:transglycosylase SLT domain-containing protein [Thiosulfativibrio zosterae]|uniref:Lytic transglycosylase n=1 Tax=Thiosulfativibrio zosterae TaxID=2675053 RepID=A0A6F8PP82_9GAMM|nr:transglycosylase SLT domain-containing protein [Thiosulfativibrio zosterae]BBP43923.1 lytic transglycosylase [Thiosulfativibrio zosterae]
MLFFSNPNFAKPDIASLTEQQRLFLEAYDAINKKDRALIADYKKRLSGYVLAPYLSFFDFYKNIDSTPNSAIEQFVIQNKDNHLSGRLKYYWLNHLGRSQQWRSFLAHYNSEDFTAQNLKCYATLAELNTQPKPESSDKAKALWQTGKPLSRACQPLENYLIKNKLLTGSMVWENINMAMGRDEITYATKLSKHLSQNERNIFQAWLKIHKDPSQLTQPLPSEYPGQVRQNIFIQGIKKLSKKDPKLAQKLVTQDAKRYGLNQAEELSLMRIISLRLARNYQPDAKSLLDQVNETDSSESTLRWQLQLALRHSDWASVLEVYEKLEDDEKTTEKWQYWLARALDNTQEPKKAQQIYKNLATKRNFYGFLAADKLKQDYQFNPSPSKKIDVNELIQKYSQLPRIKELLAIDWLLNANREWYHLLQTAKNDELEAISYLATDWQQHNIAIRGLAMAENWNNIELRFPTPHKTPVLQAAKQHAVDPAWIYGVMRRESAFATDIRSPVGATGLMQLMPNTARFIGQKIGVKPQTYKNLTNAESNIELGSAYLSYLNEKFQGNRILATAAYNAGPNRVEDWIPDDQQLPADQWIDSIPFNETRRYVKAVLEYTIIFQSLLNQKYDRLENYLLPIGQLQSAKSDSSTLVKN